MFEALVLAGGGGTRFWPASRRDRPKQFLQLEGERSLLQATVDRLLPLLPLDAIWVSTTAALAESVRAELPELPADRLLLEPAPRNTAPAIGWCLRLLPPERRRGVIAVLPADHRFADAEAFRHSLLAAVAAAAPGGHVVTLGVAPTRAEVGFGYLELAAPLAGPTTAVPVARFREKPDLATAERFLASGRHLWNAGIFVFRGEELLGHLRRLAPEIGAGLEAMAARPGRVDEIYPSLPAISIDYAVMERLDNLLALPLAGGWSDLGSWEAVADVLSRDRGGNACRGDVVALDAARNVLFAEQGTIAVLGIDDLVVVRSGDAVLVLPRERAQEVRRLVEALADNGRDALR